MLISVVLIRSQPIFPSLMPCMKCLFSSGFIYSFFFLSFFLWLQQFEYNTPHVVLFIFIPLAVHRGSCLWRLMYFNKFGKIHHQCAGNFLFVFKHFSIPSPTNSIFQTLCQLVLTRFGQWEAAGNDWKGEGGRRKHGYLSLLSMQQSFPERAATPAVSEVPDPCWGKILHGHGSSLCRQVQDPAFLVIPRPSCVLSNLGWQQIPPLLTTWLLSCFVSQLSPHSVSTSLY